MLRFEEIDDKYCNQYIEMLQEWKASNTSLTPDILEIPCNNETEYRNIVRTAKNAAIGIHEDRDWYEKCNYYLVVNDQDKLIGITCSKKQFNTTRKRHIRKYCIWNTSIRKKKRICKSCCKYACK